MVLSNSKLAGDRNDTIAADDTLSLICDSTTQLWKGVA